MRGIIRAECCDGRDIQVLDDAQPYSCCGEMRHVRRAVDAFGIDSAVGVHGVLAEIGTGDSVLVAVQPCGESFGGACRSEDESEFGADM